MRSVYNLPTVFIALAIVFKILPLNAFNYHVRLLKKLVFAAVFKK